MESASSQGEVRDRRDTGSVMIDVDGEMQVQDTPRGCRRTSRLEMEDTPRGCRRTSRLEMEDGGYQRLDPVTGRGSTEEEILKRKLKFFFMNPLEKYYATRKLPWKLLLLSLELLCVTFQACMYTRFKHDHSEYYDNQKVSLDHIFIQNWDQAREVHSYPPATGKLAVYRSDEFYKNIDFMLENWRQIETVTGGTFIRNSSLEFCMQHFKQGNLIKVLNSDFNLKTRCIYLTKEEAATVTSSNEWLEANTMTIPWHVERLNLSFNLTSMTLKPLGFWAPLQPSCFMFRVHVTFDNTDHDGQMVLNLVMDPVVRLVCPTDSDQTSVYATLIMVLNMFVIALALVSFLLCFRALVRNHLLKLETEIFLTRHHGWVFTFEEKFKFLFQFLNLWYLTICISDCLIIVGSIHKQLIDSRYFEVDRWTACSMCLGIGTALVWIGTLRYFGFFQYYNVIIIVVKIAAPHMIKFLACASILYAAFVLSGWMILGSYHIKFKTIMSTSECLFSLINGDDMFATFSSSPDQAWPEYVFSRIYLYTFISLFIFVVLSLFISVISECWDVIKMHYKEGFPLSRLEKFCADCQFDFSSGKYIGDGDLVRLRQLWLRKFSDYTEIN